MTYVSTRRLEDIADEVMSLLDAGDIFGFLDSGAGDTGAVEQRLQEVLQTRQQFEIVELAMYLRTCSSRSAHLPTWQPLLNEAVALGKIRGEPVWDIFYGMLPRHETSRSQHDNPQL